MIEGLDKLKPSLKNSAQTRVWNDNSLPPCPTPQWMFWIDGQDDEVGPKENLWRRRAHALRAVYLLTWSGKSGKWTTNWQNSKWFRRWRLPLSKWHLCWAEPQTEFSKVRLATRITYATELSFAEKLSTHFGRGGRVMFFLTSCQERNGTQKAGM